MAPITVNGKSSKMHSKVVSTRRTYIESELFLTYYIQVIIGSGHTAAIHLARANLHPVLFEGFIANGLH